MDFLHAKAASDLHRQIPTTADAFYDLHACEGLHRLSRFFQMRGVIRPFATLFRTAPQ